MRGIGTFLSNISVRFNITAFKDQLESQLNNNENKTSPSVNKISYELPRKASVRRHVQAIRNVLIGTRVSSTVKRIPTQYRQQLMRRMLHYSSDSLPITFSFIRKLIVNVPCTVSAVFKSTTTLIILY